MSALDALEAEQHTRSKHAQFAEPGGGKKRVRFAEDVQAEDEDEEAKNMERRLLFPKGKKVKDKMGVADMDEDEAGPVKAADPRVAALERAKNRHKAALHDDDEYAGEAEEDFQGDEEEQEAFEPFNLRDERREGYFDPEGNYVEYKQEREVRDAWLDSVEVDPRLAERAAAQAVEQEDEPAELSTAEVAQIKRRMADALLDGETVLQALRRLGGAPSTRPSVGTGGRRRGKGQSETAPAAPRATTMTPEDKAAFDRLTEDAMKLLDNAEYNVYSEKKETFEREAAGFEALARARAAALAPTEGRGMFDDDDDEGGEAPDKSGRGGAEGASASSAPSESAGGGGGGGGGAGKEATPSGQGALGASGGADESGYVYDEASGYYFNKELGYYYDGSTGLFCSASTSLWYKFDDSTNTYVEVQTKEDGVEPTATAAVPEGSNLPEQGATVVAM